jgi:hypothetical protein
MVRCSQPRIVAVSVCGLHFYLFWNEANYYGRWNVNRRTDVCVQQTVTLAMFCLSDQVFSWCGSSVLNILWISVCLIVAVSVNIGSDFRSFCQKRENLLRFSASFLEGNNLSERNSDWWWRVLGLSLLSRIRTPDCKIETSGNSGNEKIANVKTESQNHSDMLFVVWN